MTTSDFKDYVYPGLDLVLKLLIGIAIAYLLHRRTNADKIKERLVDTYMQFLDSHVKVSRAHAIDLERCFYKLLTRRLPSLGLPDHARVAVEGIIAEEEAKADPSVSAEQEVEVSRFTAFTYRFCLLIGARQYFRTAGRHEKDFVRYVLEANDTERLAAEVFGSSDVAEEVTDFATKIALRSVREGVHQLRIAYMKQALRREERMNLELVNPYSTAVAKAIDRI